MLNEAGRQQDLHYREWQEENNERIALIWAKDHPNDPPLFPGNPPFNPTLPKPCLLQDQHSRSASRSSDVSKRPTLYDKGRRLLALLGL